MSNEDAAGDDDRRPDRSGSDQPKLRAFLRFAEIGLQITTVYFTYRNDEAATITVTALIEIIRLMRR